MTFRFSLGVNDFTSADLSGTNFGGSQFNSTDVTAEVLKSVAAQSALGMSRSRG